MEIIQLAIDKLANSMRLYVEATIHFESLKKIDLEEAVNNLDRAFEVKLEAFHSLYDVTRDNFAYFDNADTATLILLRNAIHHRSHLLFRSWNYEMLLNDGIKNNLGAEFLLVSHDIVNAAHAMKYFYKIDDLFSRVDASIKSPGLEIKMSQTNRNKFLSQFKDELSFCSVLSYAKDGRYPSSQVYINIIPIFMSAVCKVFKSLKSRGVIFKGYDSRVYEKFFTNEFEVDLKAFKYMPIRIL